MIAYYATKHRLVRDPLKGWNHTFSNQFCIFFDSIKKCQEYIENVCVGGGRGG